VNDFGGVPPLEFSYRVPWRAGAPRPGHHRGAHHGSGMDFIGHAPLPASPDPRRIDFRASLYDPFGQWQVRVYRQRASIAVGLVADLSASMGFAGARPKLDVLADFTAALGHSAVRSGDAFAFVGCGRRVMTELVLPPTHARGAAMDVAAALRGLQPTADSATGLRDAADYLPRQRSLVFLVSDFHFPIALFDDILDGLGHHAVVPVVLWDAAESTPQAAFGLARVRDAESGRARSVLLRPALRQRWQAAFEQRRRMLEQCFSRRDLRPFFLVGEFRPDAMTAYFFGRD
jgi:uncharacterized protein (DUF58 family)